MQKDGREAILAACSCLEEDGFWTKKLPENAAALHGDKIGVLMKWLTNFQAGAA